MEEYGTWSGMLPGVWGFLQNLLTTGGVLLLLVKAFIDRGKTKEEIKAQQTENVDKAVAYGIPMIQIYKEIDNIVEKKMEPLMSKLSEATDRIKDLEDNYCCYRDACAIRIRNRADAETEQKQQETESYEHTIRTLPQAGLEEGNLHDRQAPGR